MRATARHRYVCTECGLRLEGRIDKDGNVHAYDLAHTTGPEQPCVCAECAKLKSPPVREVTR